MGTRSLTLVYEDGQPIVNMYRQFDGYPSGHGRELFEFLHNKKLVNGLGCDSDENLANGMGCLAAQMIVHFKHGAGGIYIEPVTALDCGQDYIYHVHGTFERDPLKIVVESYGKILFEGSLSEFSDWINAEENENA